MTSPSPGLCPEGGQPAASHDANVELRSTRWAACGHPRSKQTVNTASLDSASTLRDEGLLSEERIALLLSWRNSGFSVHNSVTLAAGATPPPSSASAATCSARR